MALSVDTLKCMEGYGRWVGQCYSNYCRCRGTPESVNPSVVDEEEGLPSPPLDEGAFFATQPTSIELSQILETVGNSTRIVKMAENHRWRTKMFPSGSSSFSMS
ncbi:hypothetical protein F0562_002706 [Nyssa sinensis]|uniref:Uncharacterized protein n=1 Tax=Nyssa sinensis TaxID=561372 RepID=A0A5J5BU53_9ASTE|nr:hypothetical protein F0562_002706 [Nyssa sinensis]